MTNAIALSTNFRNADNWMPLFQRINTEGGRCELALLPWAGDPSVSRMEGLGRAMTVKTRRPISELSPQGISEGELDALLREACAGGVDTVFLCDMQSYPSNAVLRTLTHWPTRPRVIGLQHGLFQSWWIYNEDFCADFLFTLGERHIHDLDPHLRHRAIAVGLPKLDALEAVITGDEGYIAFIAQKFLPADALAASFEAWTTHFGRPVRVWDHPQYPGTSASRGSSGEETPVDARRGDPYVRFLAEASWVVSGYSTGALEALHLGKQVVLLPSHGLTAWSGYPAVARDGTVAEMVAAFYRLQTFPHAIESFLRETLGGLRFDHTDRAWQALRRLETQS